MNTPHYQDLDDNDNNNNSVSVININFKEQELEAKIEEQRKEIHRLTDHNRIARSELTRIKDSIKRCESTMIIDGNDMYDWGWSVTSEVNKKCKQRFGFALHEYPASSPPPKHPHNINKKVDDDTPYMGCPNCKSPLSPVFMVHDKLWQESGMEGWPCLLCFEKAIGRRLTLQDLKPAPLCNHMLPIGWFIGHRQYGCMS